VSGMAYIQTLDMRNCEMIIVIRAIGNMASDWDLTDLHTGEVKGVSCGNSRYVRS
jgi:hypothetical protein